MLFRGLALAVLPLLLFSCGRNGSGVSDVTDELPSFSVSPSVVETGPSAGTERLEVTAGCGWSPESGSGVQWLALEKEQNGVALGFSENLSPDDRETFIRIVPDDSRLQAVSVPVLQNGIPSGLDRNGIVCALAWHLMSDAARARVSLLYPGGLAAVAPSLADYLSTDKYNAYVPGMRRMAMNKVFFYDPNTTQANGGDCLRGLRFAHYYLSHLSRFSLPDEELYFYHALLVTMVEDIHDLSLPALMPSGTRWLDESGGPLMDAACEEIFSRMSLGGILRSLSGLSKDEAEALCSQDLDAWAQETCAAVAGLQYGAETAVRNSVRNAGYRLAALLNSYYGNAQ